MPRVAFEMNLSTTPLLVRADKNVEKRDCNEVRAITISLTRRKTFHNLCKPLLIDNPFSGVVCSLTAINKVIFYKP